MREWGSALGVRIADLAGVGKPHPQEAKVGCGAADRGLRPEDDTVQPGLVGVERRVQSEQAARLHEAAVEGVSSVLPLALVHPQRHPCNRAEARGENAGLGWRRRASATQRQRRFENRFLIYVPPCTVLGVHAVCEIRHRNWQNRLRLSQTKFGARN